MFDLDLALRFGAALGLGLLLGLERERKRDAELLFGGVRTFALISLLGAVGAFLERELNQGWLVLAAFVAVSALVVVSYAMTAAWRVGNHDGNHRATRLHCRWQTKLGPQVGTAIVDKLK